MYVCVDERVGIGFLVTGIDSFDLRPDYTETKRNVNNMMEVDGLVELCVWCGFFSLLSSPVGLVDW